MKKLIAIVTLAASFAGLSAFGQGYITFAATPAFGVWDGFTYPMSTPRPTTPLIASDVEVALLWAPSGFTANIETNHNYTDHILPRAR